MPLPAILAMLLGSGLAEAGAGGAAAAGAGATAAGATAAGANMTLPALLAAGAETAPAVASGSAKMALPAAAASTKMALPAMVAEGAKAPPAIQLVSQGPTLSAADMESLAADRTAASGITGGAAPVTGSGVNQAASDVVKRISGGLPSDATFGVPTPKPSYNWWDRFTVGEERLSQMSPEQIKRARTMSIINAIAGLRSGGVPGGLMGGIQGGAASADRQISIARNERFRTYLKGQLATAQASGDARRADQIQGMLGEATRYAAPDQPYSSVLWGQRPGTRQMEAYTYDPRRGEITGKLPITKERAATLGDIYGEEGRYTRAHRRADSETQEMYEKVVRDFQTDPDQARGFYSMPEGRKILSIARREFYGDLPGGTSLDDRVRQIDKLTALEDDQDLTPGLTDTIRKELENYPR